MSDLVKAAAITPPHSTEAEQAVLGALLMDNRVFDRVSEVLRPERFYFPMHRAIFGTIARLIAAQQPASRCRRLMLTAAPAPHRPHRFQRRYLKRCAGCLSGN